MDLDKKNNFMGAKCTSCQSKFHLVGRCPFMMYNPDKIKVVKNHLISFNQERSEYQRRKHRPRELKRNPKLMRMKSLISYRSEIYKRGYTGTVQFEEESEDLVVHNSLESNNDQEDSFLDAFSMNSNTQGSVLGIFKQKRLENFIDDDVSILGSSIDETSSPGRQRRVFKKARSHSILVNNTFDIDKLKNFKYYKKDANPIKLNINSNSGKRASYRGSILDGALTFMTIFKKSQNRTIFKSPSNTPSHFKKLKSKGRLSSLKDFIKN